MRITVGMLRRIIREEVVRNILRENKDKKVTDAVTDFYSSQSIDDKVFAYLRDNSNNIAVALRMAQGWSRDLERLKRGERPNHQGPNYGGKGFTFLDNLIGNNNKVMIYWVSSEDNSFEDTIPNEQVDWEQFYSAMSWDGKNAIEHGILYFFGYNKGRELLQNEVKGVEQGMDAKAFLQFIRTERIEKKNPDFASRGY